MSKTPLQDEYLQWRPQILGITTQLNAFFFNHLMKSCHPFKSHATEYLCSTCNSGVCSDPPLPFEAWVKCTMYIDPTLSKIDTFGTSTKCPSKSDVCLLESQKM